MKKATINIEVLEDDEKTEYKTEFNGGMGMIMGGLTNAIKKLEERLPGDKRGEFRSDILELLNDRY